MTHTKQNGRTGRSILVLYRRAPLLEILGRYCHTAQMDWVGYFVSFYGWMCPCSLSLTRSLSRYAAPGWGKRREKKEIQKIKKEIKGNKIKKVQGKEKKEEPQSESEKETMQ